MDLEAALAKIKELEKDLAKGKTDLTAAETKADAAVKELSTVKDEAAARRIANKDLEKKAKADEKTITELKESGSTDKALKKELEDVTTERDSLKTVVAGHKEAQKTILDAKIEALTDDQKKLVPDFGDDSTKTLSWLEAASAGGVFGKDGIKIKQAKDGGDVDLSAMTPRQKLDHARAHPQQ